MSSASKAPDQDTPKPLKASKPSKRRGSTVQSKSPADSKSSKAKAPASKAKAAIAPKAKSKATRDVKKIRLCGACEGQVSALASYCRHCGKPLSAEVPANPYLPPPPKPWRPSRIPRHRAVAPAPTDKVLSEQSATFSVTPALPSVSLPPIQVATGHASAEVMSSLPTPLAVAEPKVSLVQKVPLPEPAGPQFWQPIPEIENRLAQLRTLHDRLRPQLDRTVVLKSRIRHH